MIALPFSYQRRPWFWSAWRLFQHDDGFEESVSRAVLVRKKVGAQAFAASFPAGRLGLDFAAIASLVFAFGGVARQFSVFRRGRTRADWLSSSAMSQRANKALEPTTIAVTPRADAQVAPATVVAHL